MVSGFKAVVYEKNINLVVYLELFIHSAVEVLFYSIIIEIHNISP